MDSMTSLNLFKFCSGLRVLGYLAILLVISIVAISYYAVVVVTCGPQLARGGVGSVLYSSILVVFHFLLYTFMETTLDTLILMPHFIKFFEDAKNHSGSPSKHAITFLAFVLNLAFALSLLCFLVMHASLLSSNATTIEVNEKNRAARWKFDVGRRKNFEQVFGAKKAYWFLPLLSTEDLENIPALKGLDFPTCSDIEA